jgi:hypothetical protein
MPESTTKPTGKKLPMWVWIAGGGAVVVGVYIYKKKKEKEEEEPSKNPYTAQSFIPVTAENVAGVGAPQVSGGGVANTENLQFLTQLFQSQRETQREEEAGNRAFTAELLKTVRETASSQIPQVTVVTGGGAPASGPSAAGPPSGGTPKSTPAAPTCPSDFPNYNPARGAAPGACWRWSRTTSNGCKCHGYKSGALECEHKSGGKCVW